MRYVVIGAGAVGGALGGRLFQHGHEVVLVARGAQYRELREHGLSLETPSGVHRLPVPVVWHPSNLDLRADDVLVLAVKSQDTAAAVDAWESQPVEGGGTAGTRLPLVCAQNGVANERIALRGFRRVYALCVSLPATHVRPGAVTAWGSPVTGVLRLGVYPSGVDAVSEAVAADLAASAFTAESVADAMRWKHGKLVANLGNAVEALCGGQPGVEDVWRAALAEGEAVLTAAGIAHAPAAELSGGFDVRPVGGETREGGSTWQSLARGTGSIETDFLNGEIVLLGREHGIATPVNEALQVLARRFAVEHREAGSLPALDLLDAVGLTA
ncbi:ketopantoate reductase family protein [Umezawaea sp. NPDC059074]|uniref:ketopantoate reductase family protein n=1 Tax=Umezawaea sp. NPDC059074 TaxID=3346716 RepID=UPI0036A71E15